MPEPTPYLQIEDEEIMRTYLRHCLPFFIEGGPGIGKSLAAGHLGRVVYQEDLCPVHALGQAQSSCICTPIKIDITEDTEVRHLLGEFDFVRYFSDARHSPVQAPLESYFRRGPMVQAMEAGRLLIVEELDRAGRDTLFPVLFDAIERKKTYVPELASLAGSSSGLGEVAAKPSFSVVITVNRSTDVGTVRLPTALLRRLRRVSLYDPSRVRLDDFDDPGSDGREALLFEQGVVMSNLAAEGLADESGVERQRKLVRQLLELIYYLRRNLQQSADALLADEHITPAESTRFICDLLRCDGDAARDGNADGLWLACRRHIGALAKNDVHARVVAQFLNQAYRDMLGPFSLQNQSAT